MPSPDAATTPGRRPEIQGLRTIAVALVVLEHFFPHLVPGGFVGVDIFFAISGYLVAGPALRAAADGARPAVRAFYARRARRLLPAASLVAVATLALFCLWLNPYGARGYRWDALTSLVFAANVRFARAAQGYFSITDPTPYRHYWSLAVEEQFYLCLPVVSWLVARWCGRRRTVVTVAAISAASLALACWFAPHHPQAAFFLPATRIWEFGLGALTALTIRAADRPALVPALGLALIGVSVAFLRPTSIVPGPLVIPAVVGTCLLLACRPGRAIMAPLTAAPSRWVGDRSYALYLTHWPVATALLLRDTHSAFANAIGVALSVLLAAVVFAAVERPVHSGVVVTFSPRLATAVAAAATAVAAVGAIAIPASVGSSVPARVATPSPTEVLGGGLPHGRVVPANATPSLADARITNELYARGCHTERGSSTPRACFFGPGVRPWAVFVGDSHSAHWFDAARAAFPDRRLGFITMSACPLFGLGHTPGCREWRTRALAEVARLHPDLVVLSDYSAVYPEAQLAPGAGGMSTGWAATLAALRGIKTVVLGDVPAPGEDPIRCLARHLATAARCDFVPDEVQRRVVLAEGDVVTTAGATWIDTWPWLCADSCPALSGNVVLYRDRSGHLTPAGSRLLAPRLEQSLRAALTRRT